MLVTLVATLCVLGSRLCIDEIITDTSMDAGLTWQSCLVGAQAGIADWMARDPRYHVGYRLDRWRCIPGHYSAPGRA